MKKYIPIFIISAVLCAGAVTYVRASAPPALTLSNNGSSVQIIVSNTDPNAPVLLFYPSQGSATTYASVNIGQTNSAGYLSTSVGIGVYGLSASKPVYVSVNGIISANQAWPMTTAAPASLVLSQSTITLTVGQSATINASNVSGNLSIPGNTNSSVVSATLNGSSIVLNGGTSGTAIVTVCDSASGCSSVNVTVQPSYLTSPGVYITPNSMSFSAGQTQTATITGYASGPFYISNNTGQTYVSAVVNGTNLLVTGLASGASNITVCSVGGQCGTLFVNISGTASPVQSPIPVPVPSPVVSAPSNVPPILSSVTISSNGGPSFVASGGTVTVSVGVNQPVNNPIVSVAGTIVPTSGSGSGPYVATYSVSGHETMPLPVVVTVTNASGLSGQSYFWVGNSTATLASTQNTANTASLANAVPPPGSIPLSVPSSGSYSFTKYLYAGMMPLGQTDPDVTALQQRLKADGVYSGPVSGYFGEQTKTGLQAYQKKHGLSPIGVVGPSTRALLNQGI